MPLRPLKLDLQGGVAVITGAAGGIGLALARSAAKRGAHVLACDIDAPKLQNALDSIRSVRVSSDQLVVSHTTDVTSTSSVEDMASLLTISPLASYPVVMVCANAGVASIGESQSKHGSVLGATERTWQWIFDVNVLGVVRTIRHVLEVVFAQQKASLKAGRPTRVCHVINTASVAGICSVAMGPYSASKHACTQITEALSMDLHQLGKSEQVKAHVLCPGIIRTDIVKRESPRPSSYQESPQTKMSIPAQALHEAMQELYFEHGMAPDALAEEAMRQIEAGRFYLICEPDTIANVRAGQQAEMRGKAIREGRAPRLFKLPEQGGYIMQKIGEKMNKLSKL